METKMAILRNQKKFSQTDLAKKSGVSVKTIQKLERRGTLPENMSLGIALKLSRVLGCFPEDLLDDEYIKEVEALQGILER